MGTEAEQFADISKNFKERQRLMTGMDLLYKELERLKNDNLSPVLPLEGHHIDPTLQHLESELSQLDKAKRTLKNLRIKTSPSNTEYKIVGLSKQPCNQQMFTLKQRNRNSNGDCEMTEITVYDYFVKNCNIDLRYSGDLPCINVGKPKRPTFIPLEEIVQIRCSCLWPGSKIWSLPPCLCSLYLALIEAAEEA